MPLACRSPVHHTAPDGLCVTTLRFAYMVLIAPAGSSHAFLGVPPAEPPQINNSSISRVAARQRRAWVGSVSTRWCYSLHAGGVQGLVAMRRGDAIHAQASGLRGEYPRLNVRENVPFVEIVILLW